MNMAEQMGFTYPETFEQRAKGKIAFLTKARDAHLRFSKSEKSAKQRAWQAELARQADAAITKLQAKLAEVRA